MTLAIDRATGSGGEPVRPELFCFLSMRDITTMSEGVDEQRVVVSKRVEYIELLRDAGPLEPRDFVDALEDSRSTVTRALEELREADLVERGDGGYEATVAATMAAREYRRHEATSRDILEASELLEPLSEPGALPPQILADARTDLTEPSAPFRPLEAVSDRLRAADTVRAYLPTLVNPSLLRLWHRRVTNEELDSIGLFDEGLLTQLQGQYPELLGEMSAADVFSAYTVDGPPYGLLLTIEDESPTVTIIVYDGEGGVRGVIVNDSMAAIEWVRARFEKLEATATSTEHEVSPNAGLRESAWGIPQTARQSVSEPRGQRDSPIEQELPVDLRTEGFVRLSTDYFDAHDQAPPEVTWQTGFTLAEVQAGHAVDRLDESGQLLANRLVGRLREGDNHVLLGPPGAGKSTTCMTVACEWFERGLGPVLYRERGRGDEFTSTSLLEAYLRQVDGHVLVVVEDAVRREANAVFDLLRIFGGRDDVIFLLDSRESEWHEADDLELDPRVDAIRRTSIQEVYVPELDEDGYERFARHYAQLVGNGNKATSSGNDLLAAVADGASRAAGGDTEPETPLLAQAQLSRAQALVSDRKAMGPDVLESDVVESFRSLSDDPPDLVTDLAVLVNLLNAAGIPVGAEYLHALATDSQHAELETAISRLEGEVLFAQRDARSAGTEYRTRHEVWSRRFLEQLLELLPTAEARASFGRCVTRLLSLADDDDRREAIQRHLGASFPRLHQIETDPSGWADEVAERIFTLGQSHSQLAPLYGLTGDGTIKLPEACSPFVECKQAWWRADMNGYQGATERAKTEIDRLADIEANDIGLSEEEAERLGYLGQRGLAMYSRVHGDNDTAHQHAIRSLELAQSLDEVYKIAQAHDLLVGIESRRSNLESAREHVEALRKLADEHDSLTVEETAVRNESQVSLVQGAYGEVKRRSRRALEQDCDGHTDGAAVYALSTLSYVALAENDFELAESSLSAARARARDTGLSMALCMLNSRFAHLARMRGDVAGAETHLQRATEHTADIPRLISMRSRALALVEQAQGNLSTAADAAREAADAAVEIDDPILKTDALQTLIEVLIQNGDLPEAERRLDQSRDIVEAAGNSVKVATCDRLCARLEFKRGNLDEAQMFAHEALETFVEAGIEDEAADCRRVLGLVALERGDVSTGREQLTSGLESADESGVVRQVARLHEAIGRMEHEAGERAEARRHQEQAVDGFERLDDTERAHEIRSQLVE